MGVVISLRDSDEISHFKEMLFSMINILNPDELLISSGYFQAGGYNVINDILLNGTPVIDILRNIDTITIVGHKGINNNNNNYYYNNYYSSWHNQFVSFVDNLRRVLPACTINAYYDTGYNWHAKETILLSNGVAVAGALGSSNYTRPAMGHTPRVAGVPLIANHNHIITDHNRETDVYIFNDDFTNDAKEMTRIANEGGTVSLIYTTLDPTLYAGRDESRILREQYDMIMNEIQNPPFAQLP